MDWWHINKRRHIHTIRAWLYRGIDERYGEIRSQRQFIVGTRKDNFLQWFKYLLTGVIETAKSRIDTFDKILQLQKKLDKKS